jgi:methionyl aminopeptidase
MTIENDDDFRHLQAIGRIVFETLMLMKKHLKPGITTKELDRIGEKHLARYGARSAPILMYDFPGHTCISINDEAAHGIPSKRIVQPGDVVNIDVSAELDGYFGDTGATFLVPPVEPRMEYLCQITKKSLKSAMNAARAGAPVNQIGQAIDKTATQAGFKTIKDLGSHGIGKSLHEDPHFIPNFHDTNDTRVLREGQVITIEPFVSTKAESTTTADDGWTLLTGEGNFSAQYEYTMVITKERPIVLTTLKGLAA